MPAGVSHRPLVLIAVCLTASTLWMSCASSNHPHDKNHHSTPSADQQESNQVGYRQALILAIENVPEYFDLTQSSIEHFEMGDEYLVDAATEDLEFCQNNRLLAFKQNTGVVGSVMFIYVNKQTGDITRIDPR